MRHIPLAVLAFIVVLAAASKANEWDTIKEPNSGLRCAAMFGFKGAREEIEKAKKSKKKSALDTTVELEAISFDNSFLDLGPAGARSSQEEYLDYKKLPYGRTFIITVQHKLRDNFVANRTKISYKFQLRAGFPVKRLAFWQPGHSDSDPLERKLLYIRFDKPQKCNDGKAKATIAMKVIPFGGDDSSSVTICNIIDISDKEVKTLQFHVDLRQNERIIDHVLIISANAVDKGIDPRDTITEPNSGLKCAVKAGLKDAIKEINKAIKSKGKSALDTTVELEATSFDDSFLDMGRLGERSSQEEDLDYEELPHGRTYILTVQHKLKVNNIVANHFILYKFHLSTGSPAKRLAFWHPGDSHSAPPERKLLYIWIDQPDKNDVGKVKATMAMRFLPCEENKSPVTTCNIMDELDKEDKSITFHLEMQTFGRIIEHVLIISAKVVDRA